MSRCSSSRWVELRNPARTPNASRAVTWSCINAISGEMTTPDTGSYQRRDLVAQRLPAAGRHEDERVATVDDVADDLLLVALERVVAERRAQHLEGGGGIGRHAGHARGRRRQPGAATQPTARVTRSWICFSTTGVTSVTAYELGHIVPSSSWALSLNPRVAYRVLNLPESWKKQTSLPFR